jgi:serine/threonine protein kinase
MALPAGSRFGPYQVASQLGEGGMGEVYRAHDTRLGRDVALKVLHSDVAQSPDRRDRFEREARAVAALNHPNIVSIFDVGEQDGIVYFVSELVEGESLRYRVGAGPLPVRELLDIAVQIADGMAAAHAAGITHRDLKPENIMLTRDGRVKILDFGLARQAEAARPAQDKTVTMNQTQPGVVMGTASYMSPEQVRGLAVDYRSDQFSFGVILYEMATGKRAFHRDTAVQTMSAIITDDPALIDPAVQAKLPPPLRWVLDRCLAKEPSRRYESTRDLYSDLRAQRDHLSETYSTSSFTALPQGQSPGPKASATVWKAAAGVLLIAALILAVLLLRHRNASGAFDSYRFTPFAVSSEHQDNPVWSPDGKAAAYLAVVDGKTQLFVRYLNSRTPVRLTSTGVLAVFRWSPDSRRIFFVDRNPDSNGPRIGIFSVAAVGGDPELVMAVTSAVAADISPDGKTFAMFKTDEDGFRRVYISSPLGSPLQPYPSSKFATKSSMNRPMLRFSPDGKRLLLLLNDGVEKRWILPYPSAIGEPREVMASLPRFGFTPVFSWFPDSRHVILSLSARQGDPPNLWVADTEGDSLRRLTSTTISQDSPAVSPDGQRILFQEYSGDLDIAKVSLADGKVIRLINTERDECMPAWASKSAKFAYVTTRDGPPEIWMHNEDGSDRPLVTQADFAPAAVNFFMNPTLSPQADRVIYTMVEAGGKAFMYISGVSGGQPTRVTNSLADIEFPGSLSPDGKQLAYIVINGNKAHLMLVKTTGQATPSRLKEGTTNNLPQWSPTGEWITFSDSNGWNLISPDGKTLRSLGKLNGRHLAFSLDGKKLYGIHAEKEQEYLYSVDLSTPANTIKNIADIGKDYAPTSNLNPGHRLSLSPDGTSVIYTIGSFKSVIWLFDGFQP